jgi:hypothetical protein
MTIGGHFNADAEAPRFALPKWRALATLSWASDVVKVGALVLGRYDRAVPGRCEREAATSPPDSVDLCTGASVRLMGP